MLQKFISFLGGQPGEESRIWALLAKGFFMGVFLATYQVGTESLFIQEVGKEYLDTAFLVTGILGILSTVVFVYCQSRFNFSSLVVTNSFFIVLFMAAFQLAYYTLGNPIYEGIRVLPFILFVMMGPISAIILLGFWGIFGRLFDTRQAKRIIGGVDTGQLFATVIAFFSIPLLTRSGLYNDTHDLITAAAFSSFGVLGLTLFLVLKWNINSYRQKPTVEEKKKLKYKTLFTEKYAGLLSLFLIFSTGVAVFVDYTFYSTTEIMLPEENDLNDFLSFFNGVVVIMSFLIQSFLNDLIIGKFGLKISLMVMPSILILLTIGGIVSGHTFGYEVKTEEFLFFFMFSIAAKAFTASLKDALESPAFKLFFLPFNTRIRFDIQTRIEGVVGEFASFLAGGVQIILGLLAFITLLHFSYLIIALALVVMFLAFKLHGQYKERLKKTLTEQIEQLENVGKRNEHTQLNKIKKLIHSSEEKEILMGLRIAEKLDPFFLKMALLDSLSCGYPYIRKYCYLKFKQFGFLETLSSLSREREEERDKEVRDQADDTIQHLTELLNYELNDISLKQLVRSLEIHDRVKAAHILRRLTEERHVTFLIELLRDINPEVRRAALLTAGYLKRPELFTYLVEHLHFPAFSQVAYSALAFNGESTLISMDSAFYRSGQHVTTLERIVQLYGRIGGRSSVDLLWKKIDFPNRRIITQILNSLSYIGFQTKDFQATRIKLIVQNLAGDIAWNIKALRDVPEEHADDIRIREAIMQENQANTENIFLLMAMVYDPQSILLVRQNLDLGTVEGITFAIELLDVFCEDEMKGRLFPIFDDMKDNERIEKLLPYYPPQHFDSYQEVLIQIINRDYNRITRYTKALALDRLHSLENPSVSYDIIANLFNPDFLLLQTAAHTLYKIDSSAYHENVRRLKPNHRRDLDRIIVPPVYVDPDEEYHKPLLMVDRIKRLKGIREFEDLTGISITNLADICSEVRLAEGTQIDLSNAAYSGKFIIIVVSGILEKNTEGIKVELTEGMMAGYESFLFSETYPYSLQAKTSVDFLRIDQDEFFDLVGRENDLLDAFIKIMLPQIQEEVSEYDKELFEA